MRYVVYQMVDRRLTKTAGRSFTVLSEQARQLSLEHGTPATAMIFDDRGLPLVSRLFERGAQVGI